MSTEQNPIIDIEAIEERRETRRLKHWLVKLMSIALLLLIFSVIAAIFYNAITKGEQLPVDFILNIFNTIIDFIKYLFNS